MAVARLARIVHRWIGVVLALLILLIGSTGVLLIWKHVYIGAAFEQSGNSVHQSAEKLTDVVLSAEASLGIEALSHIEFGREGSGLSKVHLLNGGAAYLDIDGQVLDTWALNGRAEDWLLDLHHRLLSGSVGLYIVGFVGGASLLSMVLGVVGFWPSRKSFGKGLRLRNLSRPAVLLSHRNTGALLAIPIALVLFAGVIVSFPDVSRSVFLWSYHEDDSYGESFGEGLDDLAGQEHADWIRVFERTKAVFPSGVITGAVWPGGGGIKQVLVRNEGEWSEHGNSSVHITEIDGYMDIRIDARQLPAAERAYQLLGALHRSQIGGWVYDVVQTFIGLSLIYLGLSGLFSFVKSIRKRGKS